MGAAAAISWAQFAGYSLSMVWRLPFLTLKTKKILHLKNNLTPMNGSNERHRIVQIPPLDLGLPKKKQLTQYYFGIAGTLVTAVLALLSLYLTWYLNKTNTTVKHLTELVEEVKIQNQNHQSQLNELRKIQNSTVELSKTTTSLITQIHDQTRYLQHANAPDLTVTAIQFANSNIEKDKKILSYGFSNPGGRRLKSLQSHVFLFYRRQTETGISDEVVFFTPPIHGGNTTDLKHNSYNFHFVTLPQASLLDSIISISNIAILANYVDPLSKKKTVKVFYYELFKGLDDSLIHIYSSSEQVERMSSFLDTTSFLPKELRLLKRKSDNEP